MLFHLCRLGSDVPTARLNDSPVVQIRVSFSQTHLSEGCVAAAGHLGAPEGYFLLLLDQVSPPLCLQRLGKGEEGRFLTTREESASWPFCFVTAVFLWELMLQGSGAEGGCV